ncbi:MAG: hypothetical protein LBE13_13240 [Bacteroidales bacterium]|jgi:pimeloyl-ACP methyl ester carboxylesterase|nr:hypothetical protein [Bacteroidales bacterium]
MITIKNIKKLLLCLGFAVLCNVAFAQNKLMVENLKSINTQLFCLTTATDTIEFIKIDTVNKKKPVFLFIQGSLPRPLIVDYNNYGYYLAGFNFDVKILNDFNVVEIAMPNTPAMLKETQLDSQGSYVKSKKPYDFDKTYMRRNVIETYVERANAVIDCLMRQEWIEKDSIYVYGHSQGALVATRMAAENENIKIVGFSGSNPLGRYAGIIQETRANAIRGQITEEEVQKEIENNWISWRYMVQATEVPYNWNSDLPATWKSFSQPVVEILANLKQPVFVAYGTRDYHSLACELLPIYFGLSGKTNYQMHPMLGRGHNFELIDEDGKPDWNDVKSNDVIMEFVKFVKQ